MPKIGLVLVTQTVYGGLESIVNVPASVLKTLPENVRSVLESIPETVRSVFENVSPVPENVIECVVERLSRVPRSKTDSETNTERQKSSSQSSSEAMSQTSSPETGSSEMSSSETGSPTTSSPETSFSTTSHRRKTPVNCKFGEQLRSHRKRRNMTQRGVEARTREFAAHQDSQEFIVRNAQLSAFEHGRSLPSAGKLLGLAEVYGLGLQELTSLWATVDRRQA